MEAADGTREKCLEQSFHRWIALMKLKRANTCRKSKHERTFGVGTENGKYTQRDWFLLSHCCWCSYTN